MTISITTNTKKTALNDALLLHILNQLHASGLTGLYWKYNDADALVLYVENASFEHQHMRAIDKGLAQATVV